MPYFIVFLIAFVAALLLTPLAQRLSIRWHIVAEPGGRRQHEGLLPRLGGLPLLLAYLLAAAVAYWLLPPPPPPVKDALYLRGVLLGSVVLFLGGLIDDRWELSAWPQFLIQFLGAGIAMAHLIFIERFTNPLADAALWTAGPLSSIFELEAENLVVIRTPFYLLLTLGWMVLMINAVNFFDGLDGLAAGVGTIALLLFAWHSYSLNQTTVAAFPLALAGALMGFLPYNFAPARIFLGTAGVFLLGYNLATLSILSPAKYSTVLLVMMVPILDSLWLIIDRLRRGHSPFQGDRGHLHFRLLDRGFSTRRIVLGYYGVTVAFGLVAILAPALVKLVVWLALGVAVLGLLIWLSVRSNQPVSEAEERQGGA